MPERRGGNWSYWSRQKWLDETDARNEIPVSFFGGWWAIETPETTPENLTGTDIEALMTAAPGYEPVEPTEHYGDPYQMLDGMDLSEFERQVLDAIVIAGLSYRQAGRVLGASHSSVYRTYKSVIARIRKQMGVDDE